jgi:hypothetical protein
MTLSPLTIPFDIVVVDPDLLWRVDAMNGFRNLMVKDMITVLGACDELTPGHPAIVVLGPSAAVESDNQLPALRSGFAEVRVLAVVDQPSGAERMAFDRIVPAATPLDGIVAAGLKERRPWRSTWRLRRREPKPEWWSSRPIRCSATRR